MSENRSSQARTTLPALPFEYQLRDGRTCVIREMVEGDAAEMCALIPQNVAESDFLSHMPGEFNKTVEQEREFIRDHNAKPCSMSLVVRLDGRIIAYAGAAGEDRRRYAHHAEFGLCVSKAYWRQGLGRRLTEFAVEWGRSRGLRKLYLKAFAHNARAVPLYQSLGFVVEGRLKGDCLRADGTYGDTIVMAKYYV